MPKHIAIAGNIGTGKSTLTRRLAEQLGWQAHHEDLTSNPYITDFYHDMARWGFNSQIHILYSSIAKLQRIRHGQNHAVQERTIYEGVHIFAPNLVRMGLMSERDYQTFYNLYRVIHPMIPAPDLLIYLQADDPLLLHQRVNARIANPDYAIPQDYITQLNQRYQEWMDTYQLGPTLRVPIDHIDLVARPHEIDPIVDAVANHFPELTFRARP